MPNPSRVVPASVLSVLAALSSWAQSPAASPSAAPPANPFQIAPEERARLDALAREDHADMLRQLGITSLRPGRNGAADAATNAANYDQARANPYPDWPEVLTTKDGRKVTTPELWWRQRRPEIVEDFERDVLGRIPTAVPKVAWSIAESATGTIGGRAVNGRQAVSYTHLTLPTILRV